MPDFGWHYPPGVTGNEPQLTGEWPCGLCGGAGDADDVRDCPMCGGSGIHPEDAPRCFACGSHETEWFGDLDAAVQAKVREDETVASYDEYNVLLCNDCGSVPR